MTALLAWLWSRAAAYAAAAAAGAAMLAGLWLSGRKQGRADAERNALGRDLENRRVRDAVERDVGRLPDAADRLRRDWARD